MCIASLHIYKNSKRGKTSVTGRKLGKKRQPCHTLNPRLATNCLILQGYK